MTDADSQSLIDQALAEIESKSQSVRARRRDIDDALTAKHAQDQSDIARLIVWLFAISFALIAGAIAVAFWREDNSGWISLAETLTGMLSSILLPIVTLVIGYYFGTEKRKQGDS